MKKGTIYKITNQMNGLVYIGQTVQTLKRRWKNHKSHMQCQSHHNELLQRVYNKYGFDVFLIEVLEQCDIDKLDERERYWISYYDSTNREKGYNFENGGNEYKRHSKETINKIISTHRGHNNKLNADQITEIKKRIIAGESLTEIANQLQVTTSCIYRIKKLENWQYVSPELNEAVYNTDTSRKRNQLSKEDVAECRKRILNKESAFTLSKEYNIPYGRFLDTFSEEVKTAKEKTEERKQAESLCKRLFLENVPLNEILTKTGLTYKKYAMTICGLEEVRREKNINYVGQAKHEGKTNSVIAKELGLNRCTITVYWKEYKRRYDKK